MLKRSFWAACCAAAVLASAGEARAVLIDSFNSSFEQTVTATSGVQGSTWDQPAGADIVLGGERDLILEIQANPNGKEAKLSAGGGGLSVWSNDTEVRSIATLQYDGNDNSLELNHTGLGGVDFTADGSTGLRFLLGNDLPFRATARVYSDAANWSELSLELPASDAQRRPIVFDYASFTPMGSSGGADFTKGGAFVLELAGLLGRNDTDHDVSIDQIDTTGPGGIAAIPEPGSLALLGMGALGMAGFGWRRRKQDANA